MCIIWTWYMWIRWGVWYHICMSNRHIWLLSSVCKKVLSIIVALFYCYCLLISWYHHFWSFTDIAGKCVFVNEIKLMKYYASYRKYWNSGYQSCDIETCDWMHYKSITHVRLIYDNADSSVRLKRNVMQPYSLLYGLQQQLPKN